MVKLLFLAGSARTHSVNKKLARLAATFAQQMGAEATFIDLKDYSMPLYDGDWEEENGLPETTKALKKLFQESDGVFIASPEYNSSFSPLLKNTLDWLSRKEEADEPFLSAFKGKVFALAAASPGGMGGIRGLIPLRMMLGNIGVFVTPTQVCIGQSQAAFSDNGQLTSPNQEQLLKDTVAELVKLAQHVKAGA